MATRPNKPVRRKLGGSILGMGWEDNTRQRIQSSKVVNRLISFIEGEIVLESAQVSASLGLLKKVLPDLSAVEHSQDGDKPFKMVVEWQSKES
jgi:hypothetical protein